MYNENFFFSDIANGDVNFVDVDEALFWLNDVKYTKEECMVRSEQMATQLAGNIKASLVDMRRELTDLPVDDSVTSKTMTLITQQCLRYLRSTKKQLLPNEDELMLIERDDLHINEKIVLGFVWALEYCEKKKSVTGFGKFLRDPNITTIPRKRLYLALQNFANTAYSNYRLFVFNSQNYKTPEFKGERMWTHQRTLGIYIKDNQVYTIKDISRLFRSKYNIFCPECSTSFSPTRTYEHNKYCPLRCSKCCGYGYDYPCPAQANVRLLCRQCNRVFNNVQCHEKHKGTVCRKVKCCPVCAELYVSSTRSIINKHKCNLKKCNYCKKYHFRSTKCSL